MVKVSEGVSENGKTQKSALLTFVYFCEETLRISLIM